MNKYLDGTGKTLKNNSTIFYIGENQLINAAKVEFEQVFTKYKANMIIDTGIPYSVYSIPLHKGTNVGIFLEYKDAEAFVDTIQNGPFKFVQ